MLFLFHPGSTHMMSILTLSPLRLPPSGVTLSQEAQELSTSTSVALCGGEGSKYSPNRGHDIEGGREVESHLQWKSSLYSSYLIEPFFTSYWTCSNNLSTCFQNWVQFPFQVLHHKVGDKFPLHCFRVKFSTTVIYSKSIFRFLN